MNPRLPFATSLRRMSLVVVMALLCASSCTTRGRSVRPTADVDDGAAAVDYSLWIDSEIEFAVVQTCAEGNVTTFRPALNIAAAGLVSARQVLGPQTMDLDVDEDGTVHVLDARDPCVHLKIDLSVLTRNSMSPFVAFAFPHAKSIAPDLLLWRPTKTRTDLVRTLRVTTAPGIDFSVPWKRESNGLYRVPASTFQQMSLLAFGEFERGTFNAHGVDVEIASLGSAEATPNALRVWLSESIRAVQTATGTFPVDHLQVVLFPFPSPISRKPVEFGLAARGGGAAAYFVVNGSADGDTYLGEWVAVHELSHLVLPYVDKRDAWLSEGLATYHQNVLRARARLLSEKEGWFELVEGIAMAEALAAEEASSIADATASMGQTHSYRRVYWTGATIALLLDISLRLSTPENHGLDTALRGLNSAALDGTTWTAARVLAHLDETSGTTVASEWSERVTNTVFPNEVWPLLERLGVKWTGSEVVLDDTAELVAIRRAIMAPKPPTLEDAFRKPHDDARPTP